MFSRLARYQWISNVFLPAAVAVTSACGGSSEPVKTPAADTAKKPADAGNPAPAEDKKPVEAEVKNDKPADKPVTEPKPTAPKERFALPNVAFDPPEDRKKITFGGKDVTAEACLLDTSVPELKDEWFANALRNMVAAPDGSIYLTDQDKKVRHYTPEPGETCKLAIDPKFGDKGMLAFPEEPERLTVLADGTLVVIGFNKFYKYVGGKVETVECKLHDLLPDGKSGFYRFVDDVRRIDDVATCKETDWKFKGWDAPKPEAGKQAEKWSVSRIMSWDKDYLLTMTMRGDYYLGIHSPDGKLKVKFGKDREKDKNLKDGEDICHVADAGKCAAGLCVLDGNCRQFTVWDPKKGTMIDSVPVSDLIGVFYPWPVAFAATKGFTYMGFTVKEKEMEGEAAKPSDKIPSYGVIFRVKGLN